MESEGAPRRSSGVWRMFTKKGNFMAACNECKKEYSYKTTISNLYTHWKNKHLKQQDEDTTDCSDGEWSDNSDVAKKNMTVSVKKESGSKATWQYFDVLDSDKFEARCKLCQKDISYDSIANLTEHVKEHSMNVSDDEETDERKTKRRSRIWQYMKILDSDSGKAMCLLCSKTLSFSTTISNLAQHIRRKHRRVNLSVEDNEAKKILISSNGQLYEIEPGSDGERDPISTDTVYLEDSEKGGSFVNHFQKSSPSPPKKIQIINHKPLKRRNSYKEPIRIIDKNNSSDEDAPKKRVTKMDSLDYFGQYMLSLLKDLPKHVSEQLQGDIIKQIMSAKAALQTPSYSVKISEPVTVTLNNGDIDSVAEITIQENGEHSTIENGSCNSGIQNEVLK